MLGWVNGAERFSKMMACNYRRFLGHSILLSWGQLIFAFWFFCRHDAMKGWNVHSKNGEVV